MIKFHKFYVTNGNVKAKVRYSLDNRGPHGSKCVAMFAQDYEGTLGLIFPDEYKNDTDHCSDYFDKGRVVLFEGHSLYADARARAEANLEPAKVDTSGLPAGLAEFAARVEAAELEYLVRNKLDCEANRNNCKVKIVPGKKYIKVDIGGSGRYMVDPDGNIWGIKGYGTPHFGKRYGTLANPIVRARW
jgi:hypothetical protein